LRWRKRERRRMEKNQKEAQEEMRTQDRGVYSESWELILTTTRKLRYGKGALLHEAALSL